MVRLVLLVAIIVVVALLVRKVLKGISTKRAETPGAAPSAAPEARLVRCVDCGAFVPRAEALPAPNGFRCGGAGCNPGR